MLKSRILVLATAIIVPFVALLFVSFDVSMAAQDRPAPSTVGTPVRLSDAPAPSVGESVSLVVNRDEASGERLIGSVQISGRVVPASGDQRPVRLLTYSLHLQREWLADGPMFNFVNQRFVDVSDGTTVLTGKARLKVKSENGKGEEFVSYTYEIRPRSGLTWGTVAKKDDVLVELRRQ